MARRRMFSLDVVDTDKFACMSKDARYLYYELGVRADDDGFIGSPMRIIKMTESTVNDLEELTDNGFIIKFNTGIIVIKDWLQNNQIRSDRYKPTVYTDEKHQISIDESTKKYVLTDNQTETNGLQDKFNSIKKESKNKDFGKPNDNQRFPQDRLGKDRLDKSSIDKNRLPKDGEEVANLFNDICKSFKPVENHLDYSGQISKCIALGYTLNDFKAAFINAEKSDLLKGLKGDHPYQSNFGWILDNLDVVKGGEYN